jgi:hypothetical protein
MPAFYAYVDADPDLARVYIDFNRLIANYEGKGRLREAALAREALFKFHSAYEDFSRIAPAKADELIRDVLKATEVRPPTSGNLSRAVKSYPHPTTQPAAAVDIASLDDLNKGAVNAVDGGIYWKSQEYGLPPFPNQRPATGYFMPGGAPPSEDQFRVHPYFQRVTYEKGTPALIRRRALKPRRFLERGTEAFVEWHTATANAINDRALAAVMRIPR